MVGNFVKIGIVLFVICSLFIQSNNAKEKKKKQSCEICQELVEKFIEGLKKTEKGNFGGGNTAWESKNLGNYRFSETRFEEILEDICKSTECHEFLEKEEDTILKWFKSKTKQDEIKKGGLYDELCVIKSQFCCFKDTFGPKCEKCKVFNGAVCGGRASCDGEGTREGTGKCLCHFGYAGEDCSECDNDFYEEFRNETYLKCGECHDSCMKCSGPEITACLKCNKGYLLNEETKLCEDINECLEKDICRKSEYCQNKNGSHACEDCDQSCLECSGQGPDKCLEGCSKGYKRVDPDDPTRCVDINECLETPDICGPDTRCENAQGSHECKDKSSDPKRSTKINLDDDNTYAKIRKSKSESQDETEKKNSEKTEL